MAEHRFGSITVELTIGDIAAQHDFDAVVNAANAELRTGGGVAGALHRAAGPGLEEETGPLAPISPGQAVLTSGHRLPNAYVIHSLGPVYGRDEPFDALLRACYRGALELAEREGLGSIAFLAISTGAFGYPMERAAEIALRTVAELAATSSPSGASATNVAPDDDLDEVMRRMQRDQIRRVPVVVGGDRLVGIIAQTDLRREDG